MPETQKILALGDLNRAEASEVVVLYLAVEQRIPFLPQPLHEMDEAHFRSIALPAEHGLAHESTAERDAVKTSRQLSLAVSLDAVRFACVVKVDKSSDNVFIYPGLRAFGALPYHPLEVLVHLHLVDAFSYGAGERFRDAEPVQFQDGAWIGAVEFYIAVLVGHRKSPGPVARFEKFRGQSHDLYDRSSYNGHAMTGIQRTAMNSARATRVYAVTPDELQQPIERAIEKLRRWTPEFTGERGFKAIRESGLFHFKDDVTVRIQEHQCGSEATFESASRGGKYDFGQNPRNLRKLLAAVDEELD